jgi:hypothetical protein
MGEDRTEVNRDVRGSGRVTITEAATLLGVHPNIVSGRVKAGLYDAEKVATEHGLTWMIDRDSLVNNPLPRDSQRTPSQMVNPEAATPMELVQGLLRPFVEDLGRVREELGAERARREQAERERDELAARLEALTKTPEAPESAAEASDTTEPRSGEHAPTEPAEGSQEAAQERISWVALFYNLLRAALVISFLYLVVVFASSYLFLDSTLVVGIIGVVGTLGAAWLTVYLIRRARRGL